MLTFCGAVMLAQGQESIWNKTEQGNIIQVTWNIWLTLFILTLVDIFSLHISFGYWQGEFVHQSKLFRLTIISVILMILMNDSAVLVKEEIGICSIWWFESTEEFTRHSPCGFGILTTVWFGNLFECWTASILITCLLDNVWIFEGEVTCWSFLVVKGLKCNLFMWR